MDKVEQFNKLIHELHLSNLPDERFPCIVSFLMNDLILLAGETCFRVLECEIYYYHQQRHEDIYLYGYKKPLIANYQKKLLHWYFHYSGMDLTIGDNDQIIGGILIRSIQEEAKEPICGPLKSSLAILSATHTSVLGNEHSQIKLVSRPNSIVSRIVSSVRIGLDKTKIIGEKKDGVQAPFYAREYRYTEEKQSERDEYQKQNTRNTIRTNNCN